MKITLNRTPPKLDTPLLCFHLNRPEARKALLTHGSLPSGTAAPWIEAVLTTGTPKPVATP